MKHITLASMAAGLLLTSCAETGGPVYAGAQPSVVPPSSLVPAHQAAAVARRSPGYVATPAPKFSGAGTIQDTHGYWPGSRRSGGYNNYYNTSYYGNSYYGNPYRRSYNSW
ncbi:hypothetical protein [Brevifollis gellanilyticus]|uniref:Lipoprotein n=1 Tax=Brevifollis gellanilyticus TaxID=748831 RepID=A0A512MAY5_9BACT|nr:hypothetical protein [Brevifollis gellanilyticus]GEP43896.1 hypothetical protein BGE01nite_31870 [Brevifollis gellanilyticus]